jgi:hypothetical protein
MFYGGLEATDVIFGHSSQTALGKYKCRPSQCNGNTCVQTKIWHTVAQEEQPPQNCQIIVYGGMDQTGC